MKNQQAVSPMNSQSSRPIVFGPKSSRRLGQSLAVDVIPRKACPLDCIYCELGRTDQLTTTRRVFVEPDLVIDSLRSFLRSYRGRIDHITLSASGEPTLNAALGEIIGRIKRLTDIPVAILTNGVLLDREDVRTDLLHADIVLPSLDAVSEAVFRRVNRPHDSLRLADIIEGLAAFRAVYRGLIWLEILFVQGVNDLPEERAGLRSAVRRIRPDRLHLNTVVRKPAEKEVRPVSAETLRSFCRDFGPLCSVA